MLGYFVLFTAIGFIISILNKEEDTALGIIVIVAIVWGISSSFLWGVVSLGEMALGYFVAKKINK